MATPAQPRLYSVGDRHFITVEAGRAEELREHLRSHNVVAAPPEPAVEPFASMELGGDIDPEAVQAILDEWEGT